MIYEILKKLPFKAVIHYGYTTSRYNIFVKYNGNDFYKAIHVWPMLKNLKNPMYRVCHRFPRGDDGFIMDDTFVIDDTLIVGVDAALEKFSILRLRDFEDRSSIHYSEDSLITDVEILKERLFNECASSVSIRKIIDTLGKNNRKETKSMKRFDLMCRAFTVPKLIFKRNAKQYGVIDGYVNDLKIQFKTSTSTRKSDGSYCFNLRSSKNGKKVPYDVKDDIDFFIFEIVDDENENFFYIFPKVILQKMGYLSSETSKGKSCITLISAKCIKKHWTKLFCGRFDLLSSKNAYMSDITLCKDFKKK